MNKSEWEKIQHYLNQTVYKILGQTVTVPYSLTDFQKKEKSVS